MAVAVRVASAFALSRARLTSNLVGLGSTRGTSSDSIPWSTTETSPKIREEKNMITNRLAGVIDAVNDRKLPPELRGQRNNIRFVFDFNSIRTSQKLGHLGSYLLFFSKKKINRSESDITNVVERRIFQSMLEGEFENLPGKGKPLDLTTNPHVDPAEDALYRILSRNKCAPEWIELNKEIRSKVAEWRSLLNKAWVYKCEGNSIKWDKRSEELKLQMREINDMASLFCFMRILY